MKLEDLIYQIKNKDSFLCIGLDTDINKIPKYLLNEDDPIFTFNKSIIDHTNKYCVAYKINTAFYESLGAKGWVSMKKTVDYLFQRLPFYQREGKIAYKKNIGNIIYATKHLNNPHKKFKSIQTRY